MILTTILVIMAFIVGVFIGSIVTICIYDDDFQA